MAAEYQNVLRLDVSMDDTLLMCEAESICHLAKEPHTFRDRQLPVALEFPAQGFAAIERHDVECQPIAHAGGNDGQNVRMLQPRRYLALPAKTRKHHRARQVRRQ